jgi:hypothetical protein
VQFQGINGLTLSTIDQPNSLNTITINRCRNVSITIANSASLNDWTIAQCYGVTVVQTGPSGGFVGNRTINNFSIRNSVLFSGITFSTSPSGTYTGNSIYNCNFLSASSLTLNNAFFTVQNCIFQGQSFTGTTNVTFTKNLTTLSSTGNVMTNTAPSSGNVYSVNLANVFVGYPTNTTYSVDGRFKLITGTGTNPAVGGGFLPGTSTVTDCGAYGGAAPSTTPYVLSGIPAIPVYYQLGAPSAVTTGGTYTLTFSVRSNN